MRCSSLGNTCWAGSFFYPEKKYVEPLLDTDVSDSEDDEADDSGDETDDFDDELWLMMNDKLMYGWSGVLIDWLLTMVTGVDDGF